MKNDDGVAFPNGVCFYEAPSWVFDVSDRLAGFVIRLRGIHTSH